MKDEQYEFDCMFHLCGFQRLPTYCGMFQHKSRKHVLIASEDVDLSVFELFANPFDIKILRIDPYDAKAIGERLLEYVAQMPAESRLAFNLTAGTKMMYQAAFEVAHVTGGYAHYFTTRTYAELDVSADSCAEFKVVRPIAPIRSVETFLRLNTIECKVASKGKWGDVPERRDEVRGRLRDYLRSRAKDMRYLYKLLTPYNTEDRPSFDVADNERSGIEVNFRSGGRATVVTPEGKFSFGYFPE